jgi:hypothetical protein
MVTITLPSELEKAVAEEAARAGTTTEQLSLDVLQRRFLHQAPKELAQVVPAALREQLWGFLSLQPGWNGYNAPPPNQEAVSIATSALGALRGMPFAPSRLAPSAVGGVGITYRRGKRKAYLECYNSGQTVLLLSDDDAEQLQTCKIDPTSEGFSLLPGIVKEYLDGGSA